MRKSDFSRPERMAVSGTKRSHFEGHLPHTRKIGACLVFALAKAPSRQLEDDMQNGSEVRGLAIAQRRLETNALGSLYGSVVQTVAKPLHHPDNPQLS